MVAKGRGSFTRLSKEEVIAIREQYAAGAITKTELARQYNVGRDAISRAVCGEAWHLVPGPITAKRKHAERFTDISNHDKVRAIRAAYESGGVTQAELAARFGVSPSTVSSIVLRKTWGCLV
jgi:transposase-like protein